MSDINIQFSSETKKWFSGFRLTLILALLAVFLFTLAMSTTVRVERVSGTEVGIKVNNLNGNIEVISQSGTYIYNGILHTFHLMDTTVQRLEMTADEQRGDRRSTDDLRIKTIDGSDVYLDVTINYRILEDKISEVIQTSGLGDAYKVKWIRDYSRSICRTVFGELTTEQFYDASFRNEKALKAVNELNDNLKPFGIAVTKVIAEKFRFHEEYEAKIRAKKLADQEVEEQISKAQAAEQNQNFRIMEANKKKDVFLASYDGQMKQLVVQATAEAEKSVKESEAYAIQRKLGGDAKYYQMEKNSHAILAKKSAEAEATKALADSLQGEGGKKIVKLSYAKQLSNVQITGQPYTIQSTTERFSHIEEGAATSKHKKLK